MTTESFAWYTREQAFSKLKAILRGLGSRTQDALQEAVRLAIAAITPTMWLLGSPMRGTLYLLHLPESCSNSLKSIRGKAVWWAARDLNPRPFACKAIALPLS